MDNPNPSSILQSLLPSLLTPQSSQMALISTSRQDATCVIRIQVLFILGTIIKMIRYAPYFEYASDKSKQVVGIIGCGQIGTRLVTSLLSSGYKPEMILICTRTKSSKIRHFVGMGCGYTVKPSEVLKTSKIVILACAPQHLRGVGKEIKSTLSASSRANKLINPCMVLSIVSGVTTTKVASILNVHNVIRTFVDADMLPVPWVLDSFDGKSRDVIDVELGRDYIDVGAKSFVVLKGGVESLKQCVEMAGFDMGMGRVEAVRMSAGVVFGENLVDFTENENESEESKEIEEEVEDGFEDAVKLWEGTVCRGFWEVFSKVVFAKDLPSLLDHDEEEGEKVGGCE